jgi:glycosyltransferase involved in cell wall biosynthesis
VSLPLVSVIIPTYNREEYLSKAIESVVSQTFKNIEIIVVDDGSEVNYAQEICSRYSTCRYVYKDNGGVSAARNFGIKHSRGRYIAFLDDDDLFLPNKIAKQLNVLLNDRTLYCVHSSAIVIDNKGNDMGIVIGASKEKANKRSGYVFWNALGTWCVKSPTPLLRKEVFEKVKFDEKLVVGEDLDFYQRLFYFYKVFYIQEPLACYRDSNAMDRLSQNKEKYLGVEYRTFINLLEMGIKNPFTIYKIALKLAQSGIRNYNDYHRNNIIKVSKVKLFLNPFYYIRLLK